ncbi:MAG: hydroxyacid dehydrogenase [Caldilineaceae bacterium]|nr:hydroxyacid dehydrogenase [Caldilineaceae bacterium]
MSTDSRLLITLPPQLYRQLFDSAADAALRELVEITFNTEASSWDAAELTHQLAGHDLVITGWGTPKFTPAVLAGAPNLKFIAHSAGSIKGMLPPAVFDQGIQVTHAAVAIAPAVAEMSVLLILLCLRQVHRLDRILKEGGSWESTKPISMGQELAANRVGVVGAGYTGREVIWRLQGLHAEVWVYDPYLSAERAAALGVHKAPDLDTLFRDCPIITVQAPPTEETRRMIGARQLKLLRDGGVFVNTARSLTIDQDALLAEFQTGRIVGALDVFDQEPLPVDSPFLRLENVITTPHVAGASVQARYRQGQTIVDEIRRFLAGEPLRYRVTGDMLETMA